MIKTMRAIEYNLLMTVIKLLSDRIPDIAKEYNMSGIDIHVLPSYPKDLTDLKKPSIIVRKVDTRQSKIGLGNVLGQYFSKELNGYMDVNGKIHNTLLQIDIIASNNTQRSILESMVSDDIFNMISYNECGRFGLYDFTLDINNPDNIGCVKLIGDPSIADLSDSETTNLEYIGVIRHNFSILQTIVPKQEYVDLSKWIKQSYKIRL